MVQSMKGDSLSWQTAAAAWACICTVCSRAPVPRLALPAPRPAPQSVQLILRTPPRSAQCAADPPHLARVCGHRAVLLPCHASASLGEYISHACQQHLRAELEESAGELRCLHVTPDRHVGVVENGACNPGGMCEGARRAGGVTGCMGVQGRNRGQHGLGS